MQRNICRVYICMNINHQPATNRLMIDIKYQPETVPVDCLVKNIFSYKKKSQSAAKNVSNLYAFFGNYIP